MINVLTETSIKIYIYTPIPYIHIIPEEETNDPNNTIYHLNMSENEEKSNKNIPTSCVIRRFFCLSLTLTGEVTSSLAPEASSLSPSLPILGTSCTTPAMAKGLSLKRGKAFGKDQWKK